MSRGKLNVGHVDYTKRDRSLLKQALALLEQYNASFTVTKVVCPHCQRPTWDSFADYQEKQQLEALIQRLRQHAAKEGTPHADVERNAETV